jgi:hypothetical protein
MDLTGLSKDELLAELNRREEEEKKASYNKRAEAWQIVAENTKSILSLVKHSRTNCDDENLKNAYTNSEGYPRCNRCFLIGEGIDGEGGHFCIEYLAEKYEISFELSIHPVKES